MEYTGTYAKNKPKELSFFIIKMADKPIHIYAGVLNCLILTNSLRKPCRAWNMYLCGTLAFIKVKGEFAENGFKKTSFFEQWQKFWLWKKKIK